MNAINVPNDTMQRFRAAVLAKHKKLRGALAVEVDAALRSHIARLTSDSQEGVA